MVKNFKTTYIGILVKILKIKISHLNSSADLLKRVFNYKSIYDNSSEMVAGKLSFSPPSQNYPNSNNFKKQQVNRNVWLLSR